MMISRCGEFLVRYVGRGLLGVACVLFAQVIAATVVQTQGGPITNGISLTPSVVELKGTAGQAHRQTLHLTNHTPGELEFELIAEDVVAVNGVRTFLTPGDRPDSIAATAIFSPKTLTIAPGATGSADVTVTVPAGTAVRAIAAVFRGRTRVEVQSGVAMTGSLGTLLTFTLSDDSRLDGSDVQVTPQTRATNVSFTQELRNIGTEPVVSSGAIALLDDTGRLITRVPVDSYRLLPGEKVKVGNDYPGELPVGRYQAYLSLAYGPKLLTRSVSFDVTPTPDLPNAATPRRAGGQ
jgi:hypothetical protein